MIKKTTIFATLATIFLLLLLVVFRLVLGNSKAFYLLASIDAAFIFIVFTRAALKLFLEESFFTGKIIILIILVTVLLVAAVVLSCIKFGFSRTFYLILAADVITVIVFIIYFFVYSINVRRRRQVDAFPSTEGDEANIEYNTYLQNMAGLPRAFNYEELKFATNNFQTSIGKGGSGLVFKGVLTDGSKIAVKRIDGEVHGLRQFLTEISVLASVQHINLVRLLGYCLAPRNGRFLVYEFIENGSLDAWIFPKNNRVEEIHLTWPLRYQVAIDVAKALAYLHDDCRSRILHLDIKPENILIDQDFRARVADFGISRLMGKDDSAVLTTVRGTRGYMAPEWFYGDGISEKSDVYSYGLVLLELIGGRRNLQMGLEQSPKSSYFPKIVSDKLKEGKLMEVVDERMSKGGEIDESEIRKMVYVALWCIQDKAEMRPCMELVVDMLEGHIQIAEPPETKMVIMEFFPVDSVEAVSERNRLRTWSSLSSLSRENMEFPLISSDSLALSIRS